MLRIVTRTHHPEYTPPHAEVDRLHQMSASKLSADSHPMPLFIRPLVEALQIQLGHELLGGVFGTTRIIFLDAFAEEADRQRNPRNLKSAQRDRLTFSTVIWRSYN